jgi:hypothetical protein
VDEGKRGYLYQVARAVRVDLEPGKRPMAGLDLDVSVFSL